MPHATPHTFSHEIGHVPVPSTELYQSLRSDLPVGVIPLPGEPVMGRPGVNEHVYASDGNRVGYYDYMTDVFYPDTDPNMPYGFGAGK